MRLFKPTRSSGPARSSGPVRIDEALFDALPSERLRAARAVDPRAREALAARVGSWPANSPGSLNAWLLLVTTKEPTWRDPLLQWTDAPLTLGEPHEGFFYPDPLGFWAEIRRWAAELFRRREPGTALSDALALTTLLAVGAGAGPAARPRLAESIELFRPRVVLFLDEASWSESGLEATKVPHYITDPHRPKQVYEGFWARPGGGPDGGPSGGMVVGKAPQHPTTHNLYRADDMANYLRSAPFE